MRAIVDTSDLVRLEASLAHLARTAQHPEEMLEEVAQEAVYPAIVDIFDNEGYGAWAGLSPAYARWKSEHGGGGLLELTGALRTSLTLRGAPGNVHYFASDGSLVMGSDLPYFGVQNNARPIAQAQQAHFDRMEQRMTSHLADRAREAGFEVRIT